MLWFQLCNKAAPVHQVFKDFLNYATAEKSDGEYRKDFKHGYYLGSASAITLMPCLTSTTERSSKTILATTISGRSIY